MHVHDPVADAPRREHEYGVELVPLGATCREADAIVAAVAHQEFAEHPLDQMLGKLSARRRLCRRQERAPTCRRCVRRASSVWRL